MTSRFASERSWQDRRRADPADRSPWERQMNQLMNRMDDIEKGYKTMEKGYKTMEDTFNERCQTLTQIIHALPQQVQQQQRSSQPAPPPSDPRRASGPAADPRRASAAPQPYQSQQQPSQSSLSLSASAGASPDRSPTTSGPSPTELAPLEADLQNKVRRLRTETVENFQKLWDRVNKALQDTKDSTSKCESDITDCRGALDKAKTIFNANSSTLKHLKDDHTALKEAFDASQRDKGNQPQQRQSDDSSTSAVTTAATPEASTSKLPSDRPPSASSAEFQKLASERDEFKQMYRSTSMSVRSHAARFTKIDDRFSTQEQERQVSQAQVDGLIEDQKRLEAQLVAHDETSSSRGSPITAEQLKRLEDTEKMAKDVSAKLATVESRLAHAQSRAVSAAEDKVDNELAQVSEAVVDLEKRVIGLESPDEAGNHTSPQLDSCKSELKSELHSSFTSRLEQVQASLSQEAQQYALKEQVDESLQSLKDTIEDLKQKQDEAAAQPSSVIADTTLFARQADMTDLDNRVSLLEAGECKAYATPSALESVRKDAVGQATVEALCDARTRNWSDSFAKIEELKILQANTNEIQVGNCSAYATASSVKSLQASIDAAASKQQLSGLEERLSQTAKATDLKAYEETLNRLSAELHKSGTSEDNEALNRQISELQDKHRELQRQLEWLRHNQGGRVDGRLNLLELHVGELRQQRVKQSLESGTSALLLQGQVPAANTSTPRVPAATNPSEGPYAANGSASRSANSSAARAIITISDSDDSDEEEEEEDNRPLTAGSSAHGRKQPSPDRPSANKKRKLSDNSQADTASTNKADIAPSVSQSYAAPRRRRAVPKASTSQQTQTSPSTAHTAPTQVPSSSRSRLSQGAENTPTEDENSSRPQSSSRFQVLSQGNSNALDTANSNTSPSTAPPVAAEPPNVVPSSNRTQQGSQGRASETASRSAPKAQPRRLGAQTVAEAEQLIQTRTKALREKESALNDPSLSAVKRNAAEADKAKAQRKLDSAVRKRKELVNSSRQRGNA